MNSVGEPNHGIRPRLVLLLAVIPAMAAADELAVLTAGAPLGAKLGWVTAAGLVCLAVLGARRARVWHALIITASVIALLAVLTVIR